MAPGMAEKLASAFIRVCQMDRGLNELPCKSLFIRETGRLVSPALAPPPLSFVSRSLCEVWRQNGAVLPLFATRITRRDRSGGSGCCSSTPSVSAGSAYGSFAPIEDRSGWPRLRQPRPTNGHSRSLCDRPESDVHSGRMLRPDLAVSRPSALECATTESRLSAFSGTETGLVEPSRSFGISLLRIKYGQIGIPIGLLRARAERHFICVSNHKPLRNHM